MRESNNHEIVLATVNARYIHSAFGLRYLKANLGKHEQSCAIEEFTLEAKPEDVVEQLLSHQPKIVGFGVYIWNIVETERIVSVLKSVAPDINIVLGGPEVSYEFEAQPIVKQADYLITGWGDTSFAELCDQLLENKTIAEKLITGKQTKLDALCMPYHLYTDEDLKNRILYVEASRGCPFKCEFCLSALDKTAWPFDLDKFLSELEMLYQRGARHFKFVDRTFNLKVANSLRIMQFFLDRMDDDVFIHFEVIPDHLPDALKTMIAKFPKGSLQFEIGVQSFDPEIQARISRRQDNLKAKENIQWIIKNTSAHVHADLIFGLPGDSLDNFAKSFDQLHSLGPHEIQVGILKRLKGSPIARHTKEFEMIFNSAPPYNILATSLIDYPTMQRLTRFARFWDLIGNSGRFSHSLPMLLGETPFANFMTLSERIFELCGQTHKISLLRLIDLVSQAFDKIHQNPEQSRQFVELLRLDFEESGLKSVPKCLRSLDPSAQNTKSRTKPTGTNQNSRNLRQMRH